MAQLAKFFCISTKPGVQSAEAIEKVWVDIATCNPGAGEVETGEPQGHTR